jgi:D-alanyl-D-alanine carboxypeptidase
MSLLAIARLRTRAVAFGAVSVALLTAGLVLVQAPTGGAAEDPAEEAALDRSALDGTLAAVHEAGIYGTYSAATGEGGERWQGAAGEADTGTGRPVTADMRHRIASVTKTFTAVAILQQVGEGRIDLDAPVADYLPGMVTQGLDPAITVRTLLNHTSGIGDYILAAFPSLAQNSTASLDEQRFRQIGPRELAGLGLGEPTTGAPGERYSYSNTNYVLAGLVLEAVTGTGAREYITDNVIRPAGLRDTGFPDSPRIEGPHSRMYESMYGLLDPPRDYSVYNMSWGWTAGALVSTMGDLNRFYAALFDGELLGPDELAEMRRTVPVENAQGEVVGRYGLGIYPVEFSCGRFWGHDGSVWGAGTMVFASPGGERQAAIGINRQKYQSLDEQGNIQPHPADDAMIRHLNQALCGESAGGARALPAQDMLWLSSRSAQSAYNPAAR